MSDFYSTAAQVFPVILLALIWESRYLEKLHLERRLSRREDLCVPRIPSMALTSRVALPAVWP